MDKYVLLTLTVGLLLVLQLGKFSSVFPFSLYYTNTYMWTDPRSLARHASVEMPPAIYIYQCIRGRRTVYTAPVSTKRLYCDFFWPLSVVPVDTTVAGKHDEICYSCHILICAPVKRFKARSYSTSIYRQISSHLEPSLSVSGILQLCQLDVFATPNKKKNNFVQHVFCSVLQYTLLL